MEAALDSRQKERKALVGVKHLSKSYTTLGTEVVINHAHRPSKTRQVLKDLSLEFPENRITAIVGRSGCGKSTLLKLLNEPGTQDSGEICLPQGWHTALLSPNPYVITWTSVLRNVALAGGAGSTPEERMEMAQELVKLVRLEDYADMTPQELSTGMRQRLGLARVLASRAQVLLMDEPFASLDFITREELQQELLNIQKRHPRTVLFVTHQLEEALLLAEKIVVLHADSTTTEYDLSNFAYPRELLSEELLCLKAEIMAECRRSVYSELP